jgi:hypothetical protein
MTVSTPRHSFERESSASGGTTRGGPRTSYRAGTLIELSARLSARDITIAVLLDAHRVLTTDQIATVLFDSDRTALNRLRLLRALDFIARFRPVTAGRHAPWHWTPGTLSSRFVTLARDERPPTPKVLAQRQDAVMASPQLAHTVGANSFFVDLLAYSRGQPTTRLVRWWSPSASTAAFSRRIHPDGHGVWRDQGGEVGFFLEHDTGTENHSRLVAKLDAYRRLRMDGGPDHPVLFWLPTARREATLHERFADAGGGVTVATAARNRLDGAGPAGAVWWLRGAGPDRRKLAELPSVFGEPGPYAPGPPTPHEDPLYLLEPLAAPDN